MGMNTDHLELFEDLREVMKERPESFALYTEAGLASQVILSHDPDAEDPLRTVLDSERWREMGEYVRNLPAYLGAVAGVYAYLKSRADIQGVDV